VNKVITEECIGDQYKGDS